MNSFFRDRRVGQVLADSNLLTWFGLFSFARDVQTSICEYVRNTHTHTPSNITLPHDWTIMKHPILKLPQAHPSWGVFWCMLLASWMSLGVTLAPMWPRPIVSETWTSPNVIRNFWTRQRGVQSTNPNGLSFAAHYVLGITSTSGIGKVLLDLTQFLLYAKEHNM